MRFEYKPKNLEIVLVVEGKEETFLSKENVTSDFAERIAKEWILCEKVNSEKATDDKTKDGSPSLISKQLAMVYKDLDPLWLRKNTNPNLLQAILKYTVEELISSKKEKPNSKQS